MIVLSSWAIGLVIGGISLGVGGTVGLAMFLLAGAILGSGLGGVQVSDRVLMLRLSPPEKLGEFFGLYGLVGKGSQVIGQLLFGVTLLLFQPVLGVAAYQLAVLSLLATMLVGAWLLLPVSDRWTGSGELAGRRPGPFPSGWRRPRHRSSHGPAARSSPRSRVRRGSRAGASAASPAPSR
jgi:MFS-type transporter involved in bile tolerance (Atg22 family)